MKLKGNFAFPFDNWVRGLIAFGWALAVLGLFSFAALALQAARFNRETPALKETLVQLQKSPPPAVTADLPSSADQEKLASRLKELNSLGAGGGRPVASTLSRLENLLPPPVRLVSLQKNQATGEIQLVGEAGSLEELSKSLAALENDGGFSKVALTKQSQTQGKGGNWIQFSVDLLEERE